MKESKKIIIIGTGIAGKLLEKDIRKNFPEHEVIGFVDDRLKMKKQANLGRIADLPKITDTYQVDEMVVAIPSASGELVRQILLSNQRNRIPIKIVPRSQRVIGLNRVKYDEIKDLDFEDFLGRPFLKRNVEKLKKFYRDKIVLVTGGAGSIGSEIVRQLLDLGVKKVVVFDNSEYLIFNLDQELKEKGVSQKQYELVIGSISNRKKIFQLIKRERPSMLFHAAAYKHVYLMEQNIDEAVRNNVIGTKNVVEAAVSQGIKNFVFISTDKVVNPTSVMGATKKLAEYYISCLPKKKTKFNVVRFGNVINSHGSVLPLFERQIKQHKFVTVTHRDVMRFFMSIREAAQLVIDSASRDNQGEVYVLDMGELINIHETALCLIRSKNLIPGEDVEIKFIGLKKGEKLIEELFTKKEKNNLAITGIDNVFRLKRFEKCPINIKGIFKQLENAVCSGVSAERMRGYFEEIFPSLKK